MQANKLPKNRKIRILGIAPYEGMRVLMQLIAKDRDDLVLDAYVGNLEQGVEIAERLSENNYDVIISRGGTAEMLKSGTNIPVVEVAISAYDILRTIKLSKTYTDRYALVGFSGITANAHLLMELLDSHIDIFTIHHSDDVAPTMQKLKGQGYSMVLCDVIAEMTAKRIGLNAFLISSGAESIKAAFDEAVLICGSFTGLREENQFLRNVLALQEMQTIILSRDSKIYLSTLPENETGRYIAMFAHELEAVFQKNTGKFFKNVEGVQYAVSCTVLPMSGEEYAVLQMTKAPVPFATSKYGIQYVNLPEAEERFYESFYGISGSIANVKATVDHINASSFPVMICGETGTGKSQVAKYIYAQSDLRQNPFIMVDCHLLNERSWNFLTNHYNSPFNDNGNTIYLEGVESLSDERRRLLLSISLDTNLCKRNHMIFSATSNMGESIPSEVMDFVNRLACITLQLPALRERKEEIPQLCGFYLNHINVSLANQIIGVEPEALLLLQSYGWPQNYPQFKRILNELALGATTSYIREAEVGHLLSKEKGTYSVGRKTGQKASLRESNGAGEPHTATVDITKPLSSLTRDIVHLVLLDCNGNQSAAARRLGIGRSTLWRYINAN